MHFVRSLTEDCWRSHRFMVRSFEQSKWCIDGKGVDVDPGVVYSFGKDDDGEHFLTFDQRKGEEPRAELVFVNEGDIVAFHFEADAKFFIDQKKAEPLSEAQVAEIVRAHQQAAEQQSEPIEIDDEDDDEEDDDMMKGKLENKAATKPAATKAATKPASKKSSAKASAKK